MKVLLAIHGGNGSVSIREKEVFSLPALIEECNGKMMAKMGYTIMTEDGKLLHQHNGANTFK